MQLPMLIILLWVHLVYMTQNCFEYQDVNTCITNNCTYCIINGTNAGYCMSEEFYNDSLCNRTCCSSVIKISEQNFIPNFVMVMIVLTFLSPIISLTCIGMVISTRSHCKSYDIV